MNSSSVSAMKLPALALLAVSSLASMSGGDALTKLEPSSGAVTVARIPSFPGRKVIGHGINMLLPTSGHSIKGRLITYKDGRERVPTVETPIGDVPDFLSVSESNKAEYYTKYASSYRNLTSQLTVSASVTADVMGFEGSIESKYSKSQKDAQTLYVASILKRQDAWIVEFEDPEPEDLEEHLSSRFLTALNGEDGESGLTPDKLFEKYGTHVITAVCLGGKLEYWFSSDKTESMTETEFEISVEAAYSGVSGKLAVGSKNGDEYTAENVSMTLEAVGGEAGALAKLEAKVESDAFAEWAATLPEHPQYIGRPKDSLVAIWDFCTSAERAAELESAYGVARAVKVLNDPKLFTNSVSLGTSVLQAEVAVPEHFKVISGGARIVESAFQRPLAHSYPTASGRGWIARAEHPSAGTSGKEKIMGTEYELGAFSGVLTTSVLAIYDPENFWEVEVTQTERGKSQFPSVIANVPRFSQLTGGGARVNTTGAGNYLWLSHPVVAGQGDDFYGVRDHHSFTQAELKALYHDQIGNPKRISGWRAAARDHQYVSTATVIAYAISVKPSATLNRNVEVQTRLFTKDSSYGSNPKSHIRPHPGYTLVGGGALTTPAPNMLTASSPEDADDGGEDYAWYVESLNHGTAGNAYVYAFAVGLKVLLVK